MAAMAFTSCSKDYTDWSNPQSNAQEGSAAAYGVTLDAVPVTEAGAMSADSVTLMILNTSRDEVTGFKVSKAMIGDDELSVGVNGNAVRAKSSEICEKVIALAGKRNYATYTTTVDLEFAAIVNGGDAIYLTGSTPVSFTQSYKTQEDVNGYVMLGDFAGYGWDLTNPIYMEKVSDGVYQAVVTTTNDNENWYKFYEATPFDDPDNVNWDVANAVAIGCAVNGDATTPNTIVSAKDPVYSNGVQTPVIKGAGEWTVTLDINQGIYSVERKVSRYYVVGTPNGWSSETNTMFYCLGSGQYSYTTYFTGAWDLKIWDENDKGNWDKAWGTAVDGDGAASGNLICVDSKSFQSPAAGFYTLTINMNSSTYEWTPVTEGPAYETVSIIGDFNGWNGDVDMQQVNPGNNDNHNWYVEATIPTSGGLKFRANHDWTVNWGGGAGDAVDSKVYYGNVGGENITVPAGKYRFYLNDITGQWSIVAVAE